MKNFQRLSLPLPILILAQLVVGGLRSAQAATYYVDANGHNSTPPFAGWTTAATNIQDAVDLATTNDVVLVTNGVYRYGGAPAGQSVSNRVYVTNVITIRSINGPAVTTIKGSQFTRCARLEDGATLSGFTLTNGAGTVNAHGAGVICAGASSVLTNCTIAGNAAAGFGGGIYSGQAFDCVISNNISYFRGGGAYLTLLSNCIVCGNVGILGYSVPGGGIYGGVAVNCVFSNNLAYTGGAASSASLFNCRLMNNSAGFVGQGNGGGADSCNLTNCFLTGNVAANLGGGAVSSTLVGCVVYRNYATNSSPGGGSGGGVGGGILVNCTVVSNLAGFGGGLDAGSARNSILYYNNDAYSGLENSGAKLTNCCTTPLPTNGIDNFTQPPLFMNMAAGDFRLQSTSPCINAGNNRFLSVDAATDLDGNPRITGGSVDVGAYEFQSPSSVLSYAWAQSYGLPTDGSADLSDPDGDGVSNWQEWIAGTSPTNPTPPFLLVVSSNTPSGPTLSWPSVNTRVYSVERASRLQLPSDFLPLTSNIPGQPGTTSYTDSPATNAPAYFYRVSVHR